MGGVIRVWGLLHTRFVLHQNSGAPIRLLYLQLMHSFWFSNFARVLNSQAVEVWRRKQMRWCRKILNRFFFFRLERVPATSAYLSYIKPDCDPSIVVVVIPLKALMKDQVRLLRTDQSQLSYLIKLNNTGINTLYRGEA